MTQTKLFDRSTRRIQPLPGGTARPLWHLDLAVVISGACLIAVLVGRVLAWSAGAASSVPLLVALLAGAVVALGFGQKAREVTQERGGLHRFLGRLCQRAAAIQTALAVATLAWALFT